VGNAVGFQEAVYLDSGEPEHFAELWFGDASSPEFFQREGFERAARQTARSGHGVDQFIRDLKGDIHKITVTRPPNGVKRIARPLRGISNSSAGGDRIQTGARMIEFSFPRVSVASSGGEYFQVKFAESEDSEEDDAYFLIQRQFESYDGGLFYLESHEIRLRGHFKIRRAELGRDTLRLQVACEPAKTVQINFQADGVQYNQLKRILKLMMPGRILSIEKDRRSGPEAGNSRQ
jgi:hypothetical protein